MRNRGTIVLLGLLAAAALVYVLLRPGTDRDHPSDGVLPALWSFEFRDLVRVAIDLPGAGQQQAWVKREDSQWYFDHPNGPRVSQGRWAGGVPLLLSAPRPERRITGDQSEPPPMQPYGLADPRMVIDLLVRPDRSLRIVVGDPTVDGQAYYIMHSESSAVYTIDHTWVAVLTRLVLDPPYPEGSGG